MNHCIDATCAHCGTTFCLRCEGNLCPECGKLWQPPLNSSTPLSKTFSPFSSPCRGSPKGEGGCGEGAGMGSSEESEERSVVRSSHFSDFRRYSFLCCLLNMFAASDGFKFKIERHDNLIQVWLYHPGKQEYEHYSINFDHSVEQVESSMRHLIQQIVFFTQ